MITTAADINTRKYFPLGKAYGVAFCNRVEETAWLAGNLESTKHSLLIAPRRYGKSSLAERGIAETKFPFAKINFHLCTSEEEIAQLIVNNTIKLIGDAIGKIDKITHLIKKYTSNLQPKFTLGDDVATLELISKEKDNHALVICESLLLLEKLLRNKNKRAVIFLDEFQEITKISQGTRIEGAIRTAAQEMQQLSIIFSGSMRSLLETMFDNEKRPLYKLCRKLKLERISELDYEKHLNKIALKAWQQKLDDKAFNEIMLRSSRHPYYVNYLCDIIWDTCKQPPTTKDVISCWDKVVEEEWRDGVKEISILPITHRKILKLLATEHVTSLTSQAICAQLGMAASSIASATSALVQKDYIEQDENDGYRIINPLLSAILSQ